MRSGRRGKRAPSFQEDEEEEPQSGFLKRDKSAGWARNEDKFMNAQKYRGALIRILENRYRPADLICAQVSHLQGLSSVEDDVQFEQLCKFELPSPPKVLRSMSIDELGHFKLEMAELSTSPTACSESEDKKLSNLYWDLVSKLLVYVLDSLQSDQEISRDERAVDTVASDISLIIDGKSDSELCQLHSKVELMLRENQNIDTYYWERVLQELNVRNVESKLDQLTKTFQSARGTISPSSQNILPIHRTGNKRMRSSSSEKVSESKQQCQRLGDDLSISVEGAMNATVDGAVTNDGDLLSGDNAAKVVLRLEEVPLNQVKDISNIEISTSRIKPKYSAKVITSHFWNKRSRALHSKDNPPPKAVKGYAFEINYPNLPASASTPTYTILQEKDGGKNRINGLANSMCILLFESPAPYQHLAFRIVNSAWDRNINQKSSGFISQFENGVLCLKFQFKQLIYQRR